MYCSASQQRGLAVYETVAFLKHLVGPLPKAPWFLIGSYRSAPFREAFGPMIRSNVYYLPYLIKVPHNGA